MTIKTQVYNKDNDITEYTLTNSTGSIVVKLIDLGATITHILVPDRNGQKRDVVLGWDNLDEYLAPKEKNPYMGSAIGRVANRIPNGKFDLNGKAYQLAINSAPNSLHGGLKGFDKRKWSFLREENDSITFELKSEDGEEGYPGTIRVELKYSVNDSNELLLEYSAKLSEDQTIETIINLTNHSYFNLNGCTNDTELDVLNHTVRMTATEYLEINDDYQPTGRILSTKSDSPIMDFSLRQHSIGERIAEVKPNGYDHCYVVPNGQPNDIRGNDSISEDVVEVMSPLTGITLKVSTTEPGVQFYTGNNLSATQKTKTSQSSTRLSLRKHSAFCLETQRFSNAINWKEWKRQVILSPGATYRQTTVYKFSVQ